MRECPDRLSFTAFVLLLLPIIATDLAGQATPAIRRSQQGSVSQTIASTQVSITYSRPVARGRKLFGPGGVVPYGREWCPGADRATRIELSRDVFINGQPLAAGSYSIWAIPNADQWTWIFSKAADVFHTPYPRGQDALRLPIVPITGVHMETMAYHFPLVDADSAIMNFHWGETVIALKIRAS